MKWWTDLSATGRALLALATVAVGLVAFGEKISAMIEAPSQIGAVIEATNEVSTRLDFLEPIVASNQTELSRVRVDLREMLELLRTIDRRTCLSDANSLEERTACAER